MAKKCNYCNYELNKDWKYCPNCGKEIKSLKDYLNIGMEDVFQKIIKDFGSLFGNIINSQIPKLEIKVEKIPPNKEYISEQREEEPENNAIRDVSRIIDPKMIIRNKNETTIIELMMPEIESLDDVDIKEFRESVEVRAYFEDSMYFKIISIPQDKVMEDIVLENGILKLIFEG